MHTEEITVHAHPHEGTVAAAAFWPSWHYDVGRSVYWYLCTHHLAYFIHPYSSASETYAPQGKLDLEMLEYQGPCFCEQNWSMANVPLSSWLVKPPCCYENYEGNASTAYSLSSSSLCPADENEPSLPSGWVEDFLIDCYLGGSFGTGELYRLRQPSSKYLSSIATYDSSNPTKGWIFPCISFTGLEDIVGHSECVSNAASKLSLVAKPFVPNLGHQRYQHLNKRKIASPTIPVGLRSLSRKELVSVEERKQKYRDRAKERRELHGVDVEHAMHHNNQELGSVAKDTNNGSEKESKRHLTAQHMLEKMGWCEGEGLGKRKDGLKEPLNELSNRGRAGIGWFTYSSSPDKKRLEK